MSGATPAAMSAWRWRMASGRIVQGKGLLRLDCDSGDVGATVQQPLLDLDHAGRGVKFAWLLVVEVAPADGRCGVIAHREPRLRHWRQGEVVGCAGAAHLGRYPARLEGIGQHSGPAPGDSEGQHDIEKLAV